MPNYDGPLYAPYNKVLMGKLTKRQWQEVFTIVRQKQKGFLEMFDEDHYNELGDILDVLYHIAYPSKSDVYLEDDNLPNDKLPDDWSYE